MAISITYEYYHGCENKVADQPVFAEAQLIRAPLMYQENEPLHEGLLLHDHAKEGPREVAHWLIHSFSLVYENVCQQEETCNMYVFVFQHQFSSSLCQNLCINTAEETIFYF